jgi:cobalt-zinc-cadmium efflux system outer membrane protein
LSGYTESTVEVSQRLELGGKRQKRVAAAEKEMGVASEAREVKKAELTGVISHAFVEVLAGQERLANQRSLTRLARQAQATVIERVAAGKVSPVEETRATVALATAELAEEKQLRGLIAAKDRLSALWGGRGDDFDRVGGRFEVPPATSSPAEPCPDSNPDLKLAAANVDFSRATLVLEEAARKPDVTVSGGFRHLNLEDVSAWVASVSIPLPFYDRRQGAIAEARIRVDRSLSEKKAVEWRLHSNLTRARQDHETALLEANTLTRTALPAAREALSAVEEGYRFGKFDFMNVLDAQRTHAELQRQYIEAVASGLNAAIEIERLAGCNSPAGNPFPARDKGETTHDK